MKDLKNLLLKNKNTFLIALVALLLLVSWLFLGFDNPIEEFIEEIYRFWKNKVIDLSPFNPDPDFKD